MVPLFFKSPLKHTHKKIREERPVKKNFWHTTEGRKDGPKEPILAYERLIYMIIQNSNGRNFNI